MSKIRTAIGTFDKVCRSINSKHGASQVNKLVNPYFALCRPTSDASVVACRFLNSAVTESKPHTKRQNGNGNGRKLVFIVAPVALMGTALMLQEKADDDYEEELIPQGLSVQEAIAKSRELIEKIKVEVGAPGLSISVSVNGQEVWKEGFGYSDLENNTPCKPETVMRIASISKPMAMAIVARLWENNKLDLDKCIKEYVKSWPEKTFEGKPVTITTRQLVSHLGGIRHYSKDCGKKKEESKNMKKSTNGKKTEFDLPEYHIKTTYTISESLNLFANDELCSMPGTEFLYTTHGYTLLSAVAEGAAGKDFKVLSKELFSDLGLSHTFLEEAIPLIHNRARFYAKDRNGKIQNTPYVDNSYKWAGGGYMSTVSDLIKFGNAMLYSYQYHKNTSATDCLPGYLKRSTMEMLWTAADRTQIKWDVNGGGYGMGWGVMDEIKDYGCGRNRPFYVSHTGGAVGASSVLVVIPSAKQDVRRPPRGVVVAILTNMQSVGLNKVGYEIGHLFSSIKGTN